MDVSEAKHEIRAAIAGVPSVRDGLGTAIGCRLLVGGIGKVGFRRFKFRGEAGDGGLGGRGAFLELGDEGFQVNAGVRIRGGFSRSAPPPPII